MAKYLLTLLFQTILLTSYSQKELTNSAKLQNINKRIENLEGYIREMKSTQGMILQQRMVQASEIIEGQSKVLGSEGNFLTIISVIIGILTMALPILTYFFGIKPSQDAVKELQENVNKKISEYLNANTETQIDQSIQSIINGVGDKSHEIAFLNSTPIEKVGDSQMFEIMDYLSTLPTESDYPEIVKALVRILGKKKTKYADKYFSKMIENDSFFKLRTFALEYLSIYNPELLLNSIVKRLSPYRDRPNDQLAILNQDIWNIYTNQNLTVPMQTKVILSIFDDAVIFNCISPKDLGPYKDDIKKACEKAGIPESKYANTKLGRLINK